MEVFSVFTTMNLVDMISNPLSRINGSVGNVTGQVNKLSTQIASLAASMLPIIAVSGVLLGIFGTCVGTAAAFEDQMAKVGAISRASAEDMRLLEESARSLGASTQFTAVQVAEGQQYLAMAGFTAKENIEALPAVLNMAAATATDLGRASDISSDILSAFGLEATQMARVADVLALTCSTANTNMELLGDTMKYVAPIARQAGMSLEETSAMAGLLGNIGIKGSQAGTSLKAMLNKLAAPTGEAQELFDSLNISIQDVDGNLRSPISVLGELSEKMSGMGTATQIAAMKTIVGEEAISGFAELIKQEGITGITKYTEVLNNAGGSAEEMAKRMNDTLLGSTRSMNSAFESVKISIGKMFIPFIKKAVDIITVIVRAFDSFIQHPIGAFLIELLATISSVILTLGAFGGACWAIGAFMPKIATALSALKMAFLGLSFPIQVIIGAIALLYIAYRTNFGGMADIVDSFFSKIRLVFQGVITLFKNIENGSSSITGDLAKKIEEAGLTEFITGLFKVLNRLKAVFMGVFISIKSIVVGAFNLLGNAITTLLTPLEYLGSILGFVLEKVFGLVGKTDLGIWQGFGACLGVIVVLLGVMKLQALATAAVVYGISAGMTIFAGAVKIITALQWAWNAASLANPLVWIILGIIAALAVCVYYFDDIVAGAKWLWDTVSGFFSGLWDSLLGGLSSAYMGVTGFLSNIGQSITGFFSGINLYESGVALLSTFKDGIMSTFQSLKDTVSSGLQYVRDLLPFSDAKEGPLSTLTLSGSRLMTTIGEGVTSATPNLMGTVQGALANILPSLDSLGNSISSFFNGLFSDNPEELAFNASTNKTSIDKEKESTNISYVINIENMTLPNVENGNDFASQLQAELAGYGV